MNNSSVKKSLDDSALDLKQAKCIIDTLGYSSSVVPYLSKYAIIKACGTIEQAFKNIVYDYCSHKSKKQVKQYLSKKILDSPANQIGRAHV